MIKDGYNDQHATGKEEISKNEGVKPHYSHNIREICYSRHFDHLQSPL